MHVFRRCGGTRETTAQEEKGKGINRNVVGCRKRQEKELVLYKGDLLAGKHAAKLAGRERL